jgi:UDP-galactopyranose mutase
LSGIGKWDEFILKSRSEIDGKLTPCPFNFKTIDDFYAKEESEILKERLKDYYKGFDKVSIVEMLECSDAIIRSYATFLFEKDYRPYTAKQWGIDPKDIDISILKRVPVRLSYVDCSIDDPWQALPRGGYTVLFAKLLGTPGIDIRLNADILPHLKFSADGKVFFDGEELDIPIVYTGPLDELFECRFGRLPYRSLLFDFETLPVESYQEAPCVVYPMAKGFTRVTEYTKLPYQNGRGLTVICKEYPVEYKFDNTQEAYYPVLIKESRGKSVQYKEFAKKYKNLYLCGRLADFIYFNMDEVVLKALTLFRKLPL